MVGRSPDGGSLSVPLKVGARVILNEEYEVDDCGSYACKPFYEATVEQCVPETMLIRMSDGTGRAELIEKINRADGVEVINDYE